MKRVILKPKKLLKLNKPEDIKIKEQLTKVIKYNEALKRAFDLE